MGGQTTEFLKKFLEEFHCLKGIVLSNNDGILLGQSILQKENQKFIQTTSMLISAVNQAQNNLQKTKSYPEIRAVNYYYDQNLIHLAHSHNLMVTLFLNPDTNIDLARDISINIINALQKMNAAIHQIKTR